MHIAITGGIGSGKSYVCHLLEQRGIQVYDCDAAAKRLMREDAPLREALKALVGPQVYEGTTLQKRVLAAFLLESEAHKQAVNDVVHPAVARDFLRSGMVWLESAILFESGFDRRISFDKIVMVSAPEALRAKRIMARDHLSQEKAEEWIRCQMSQEEVRRRSDFEIINDGRPLEPQVEALLIKVKK